MGLEELPSAAVGTDVEHTDVAGTAAAVGSNVETNIVVASTMMGDRGAVVAAEASLLQPALLGSAEAASESGDPCSSRMGGG